MGWLRCLGSAQVSALTGITLGGGLGWLSGLHGAACDNLLSARVVTADGRMAVCRCGEQPGLVVGPSRRGREFWRHDIL